jgi:hypothetical protein
MVYLMPNSGSRSKNVSLAAVPLYRFHAVADHLPDFVFAQAGDQSSIVDAVAEQFPLQPDALVNDIGHVVAHCGVQRYTGTQPEVLQRFHHTPYARPVAIVAQRIVQDVRIRTRPQRAALSVGRIDLVELDVGAHPKCNARTVGPTNDRPVDER